MFKDFPEKLPENAAGYYQGFRVIFFNNKSGEFNFFFQGSNSFARDFYKR